MKERRPGKHPDAVGLKDAFRAASIQIIAEGPMMGRSDDPLDACDQTPEEKRLTAAGCRVIEDKQDTAGFQDPTCFGEDGRTVGRRFFVKGEGKNEGVEASVGEGKPRGVGPEKTRLSVRLGAGATKHALGEVDTEGANSCGAKG